jgi:hypothetical protein
MSLMPLSPQKYEHRDYKFTYLSALLTEFKENKFVRFRFLMAASTKMTSGTVRREVWQKLTDASEILLTEEVQ